MALHVICVYDLFFPRWRESVTRSETSACLQLPHTAHGHTGTRHTQGKEAAFIQDDKDASAEWGGAQFYKLAHGCHTQFSFTQNLALTRVNSEKGWSLIEVWQAELDRAPILMQGRKLFPADIISYS